MRAEAAIRGIRSLRAVLVLALVLAAAPAVEAVKHGPAAMAAEADDRAVNAVHGHAHDIAGAEHHESGDHDHVGTALPAPPGAEARSLPARTLRPGAVAADGTIRDGPRRPPRPTTV